MNKFAGLMIAVAFIFGIAVQSGVSIITSSSVRASTAQPKCSSQTDAPAPTPTVKSTPDRYRIIANAVSSYVEYKESFERMKEPARLKSIEDWGSHTRDVYKLSSELSDFSKEIAKNELRQHEIGFTETDVRHLRRDALKYTLVLINKTVKVKTSNLYCLWEGGCLDKDNLPLTIKMVRDELAETE